MNAPLPPQALDSAAALDRISGVWDASIVPQLTDYIRIPAKSPGFAPDWQQLGHIETVLRNAAQWVEAQKVAGLQLEIVRLPGRTPVLFFEIDSTRPAPAFAPTSRSASTATRWRCRAASSAASSTLLTWLGSTVMHSDVNGLKGFGLGDFDQFFARSSVINPHDFRLRSLTTELKHQLRDRKRFSSATSAKHQSIPVRKFLSKGINCKRCSLSV